MNDLRRTILWSVFAFSLLMLWDGYLRHTGQPSMFLPGPAAAAVAMSDVHLYQAERAMALGASAFLKADEDLAAQVRDHLGGEPDVVFECVGKPGLIDHCIGLVRPRGTVVVLGLCTARDHFDAFRAISKEVRIVMSVFFNMREFHTAIDALDGGRYAPQALISETIALGDLPTAFEALRQRTTQCKVLVDPFAAPR